MARRSLPAIVAVISLAYNLVFAAVCSYLPDDPLDLGVSLWISAWAGCALSVFGLVGIATERPSVVISFAYYLLVDTFMSAFWRLFFLQLFVDAIYEPGVCDNPYASPWRQEVMIPHSVITSARRERRMVWLSNHAKRCHMALEGTEIGLVTLLVVLTGAQGALAMAMRRYGKSVERAQLEAVVLEAAALSETAAALEKA